MPITTYIHKKNCGGLTFLFSAAPFCLMVSSPWLPTGGGFFIGQTLAIVIPLWSYGFSIDPTAWRLQARSPFPGLEPLFLRYKRLWELLSDYLVFVFFLAPRLTLSLRIFPHGVQYRLTSSWHLFCLLWFCLAQAKSRKDKKDRHALFLRKSWLS